MRMTSTLGSQPVAIAVYLFLSNVNDVSFDCSARKTCSRFRRGSIWRYSVEIMLSATDSDESDVDSPLLGRDPQHHSTTQYNRPARPLGPRRRPDKLLHVSFLPSPRASQVQPQGIPSPIHPAYTKRPTSRIRSCLVRAGLKQHRVRHNRAKEKRISNPPAPLRAPHASDAAFAARGGHGERVKRGEEEVEEVEEEEPLGALSAPKLVIDQATQFWESYNKMADFEDREFVKALGVNLETLLIFAGLFSGVNTAFILESLKTVQPDHTETTNHLIRSVVLILQNVTVLDDLLHDETFQATPCAVRSTAIFFSSLCFSLTAAFGAVIGKQWLNYYEREGSLKPPQARARERQRKYENRDRWHLEGILETLPTILEVSLFLFLLALVDFLRPINATVASVTMGFSLIPVLFYLVTTTIAAIYPLSPFQTRLSVGIRVSLPALAHKIQSLWNNLQRIRARLDRFSTTLPTPLRIPTILTIYTLEAPFRLVHYAALFVRHNLPSSDPAIVDDQPGASVSDVLNLQCLILYMKRVSTPQDISTALIAIGSLALDLRMDQCHPVIKSFVETMLKFILKPAWDLRNKKVVWGNPSIDFQLLVKIFHLIYVRWSCILDFSSMIDGQPIFSEEFNEADMLKKAIREALWGVFSRDPLNVDSVTQIADIMEVTGSYRQDCVETNTELLCRCLSRRALSPDHYLPYVTLLSFSPFHQLSTYSLRPEFSNVTRLLLSTMWVDGEPDFCHRRAFLRVAWLSGYLADTVAEDERRFSLYLVMWFLKHSRQENVVSWYLQAVFTLLDSEINKQLWVPQLEQDDHPVVLLRIIRGEGFGYPDKIILAALRCFIKMWESRHNQPGSVTKPLYLTPKSVASVVAACSKLVNTHRQEDWLILESTVLYLEDASRLGLLENSMKPIVEGYKWAENRYLRRNPRLRQGLQARLARLVFV